MSGVLCEYLVSCGWSRKNAQQGAVTRLHELGEPAAGRVKGIKELKHVTSGRFLREQKPPVVLGIMVGFFATWSSDFVRVGEGMKNKNRLNGKK